MDPSPPASNSPQTLSISFPVPSHSHLLFLAHLTLLSSNTSSTTTTTTTILHLTTTPLSTPSTTSPLGSFVYALPDRISSSTSNTNINTTSTTTSKNTISTPLSTSPTTIEYTTRLAKILAQKLNGPVYVGCSIDIEGMTVEEEIEGLKEVVGRVCSLYGVITEERRNER